MSFLAPLFLLGGLLIAGPVLAHLIRRATRERVPFTATQFLEPSPPRLNRRNRIEHWWLLALRCLVVLVLAAGFARPFFKQPIPLPPPTNAPQHLIAVLDESASMQRRGLWPAAIERIRSAAADLGPNDRFALVAAGNEIVTVLSSEQWTRTPPAERASLVSNALSTRQPGWGPTHLDTAVEAGLEELNAMAEESEGLVPGRLLLVSDFTVGARVAGLAGRDWPAGLEVEISRVEPAQTSNASLHWLGWTMNAEGDRAARVRVSNHGTAAAPLRLQLRDAASLRELGEPELLTLAPQESRVVLFDVDVGLRDPLRLEIAGDGEPFDNAIWMIPPQSREFSLPYFGRFAANDPQHSLFYLSRAVEGWRDPKVQIAPLDPTNAPASALADVPLVVVAEPLSSAQVESVRTRIEAGAFALVLLADGQMLETAAAIAGERNWQTRPTERADALLGQIDFRHPLFAPFADPRFSDFSRIRFWRPVPIVLPADSNATVVAHFDDGSPAVVEATVGAGRVVVWGGDWATRAGQWVLSTKFVPWFQALMERATGGPPRRAIAEVGDVSTLATEAGTRWRSITAAAAGANANNDASPSAAAGTSTSSVPGAPGVYQLEENGRTRWVALQVPTIESRNDPLPLDTWEQLGVPLEAVPLTTATATKSAETAASAAATESQQQLWRWLLIAAIVVLAVESLAAAIIAQRSAASPAPQA